MPRDILQLDLDQVDPREVHDIQQGAMFNLDIPSADVLAVMEVAVVVPNALERLKPKKEKHEKPDPHFRLHTHLRLD